MTLDNTSYEVIKEHAPSGAKRAKRRSWIDNALDIVKKSPGEEHRIRTYDKSSSASSTASAIRRGKHGKGFSAVTGQVEGSFPAEYGIWVTYHNNTKENI